LPSSPPKPRRRGVSHADGPRRAGPSGVVNPVLLWPVIGDWVFRVLGAEVVTRQMATAYAGSPDQPAMLVRMEEQSTYRGFAVRMLNCLRHYDFGWRPDVLPALGSSELPVFAAWGIDDTIHPYERTQVLQRYVPQTKLLTLDGAGHAITYGRAEQVLAGYSQFLRNSAR
jgi:pimeloyl-ACP methyl ester carboxylesterase